MTKTVLLYSDTHDCCGVGFFNAALLEGLVNAGYRVVYAKLHEQSPLQFRLQQIGVEYRWLDYSPNDDLQRFSLDQGMPLRVFTDIRPDLIFFAKGAPTVLFGAIEAARALFIPYIIREGAAYDVLLPPTNETAFIQSLQRQYDQAVAVICVSRHNLDALRDGLSISADIGTILPSSADKRFYKPVNPDTRNHLRQTWGIPEDGIVCFTSAQLEICKGHGVQVTAMHMLKDRPEWERLHFVWAGEGSQRERIIKVLDRLGLADRVRFLGQVWNVDELLDAADIFVLTSVMEGMGRACPEAMAKGLPVIATRVGGIPEAVGEHAVLLSPPTDVKATAAELVNALVEWVNDDEGRKKFGEAGKNAQAMKFFEPEIIGKYLEVIANI